MESKPDTVLIYSGGLDSTVLLYKLIHEGRKIAPLSIAYGQRHEKELEAAARIIANLRALNNPVAAHLIVAIPPVLFKGSSQTSVEIPVPLGHYAEETMKATIVPNRNMVLLALANAYAQSIGADLVTYAAHGGDHAIYPDCREDFVEAMDRAFFRSSWNPPRLTAPFLHMDKTAVVKLGAELNVPFHLTWSCYQGRALHCGRCGTCVERREAFALAGVDDPTGYEEGGK